VAHTVEILPGALRGLRKLPHEARRKATRAIDALMDDPRPPQAEPLKKDLRPLWKLRVGKYRIVYRIEDDVLLVLVVVVADRKIVYEQARRARWL